MVFKPVYGMVLVGICLLGDLFWMFDCIGKSLFLRAFSSFPAVFAHVYFLAAVLVGWVLFYFESFHRVLIYLKNDVWIGTCKK